MATEFKRKPRIGLVGFFGWGNFGDELFLEAHRQRLADLVDVNPLNEITRKPYFKRPVDEVIADYEAFVIGGGDLVIPWQVSELYWKEEYLRKPVYVIGVGVPTWGGIKPSALEHYRRFFRSENVRLVLTRDKESADWINKHIEPSVPAAPHTDLVCAMRLPKLDVPASRTLGIVVRQRKHGDDFSQVRALCTRAKALGYNIRHIVLGTGITGEADFQVASELAVDGEEIIYDDRLDVLCKAIGSCQMLASMKFHGTVVASMYGVPSIVLSATDKSRNFMRIVQREELLSSFSAEDLPERLPHYPARIPSHTRSYLRRSASQAYDKLRHELAKL